MTETLRSVLLGTSALWVMLGVAVVLAILRPWPAQNSASHGLLRPLVLGIAVQSLHFVEEHSTGFPTRFPELLGLAPWPGAFFVPFNLAWLAIWGASAAALRRGVRQVAFLAWFLALALTVNGVAHPLLSLRAGGYFPGLITSPIAGFAGVVLLARLRAATRRP